MQVVNLANTGEKLRGQGLEEAEASGGRLEEELAGPADTVLDLADDGGSPAQGVAADKAEEFSDLGLRRDDDCFSLAGHVEGVDPQELARRQDGS